MQPHVLRNGDYWLFRVKSVTAQCERKREMERGHTLGVLLAGHLEKLTDIGGFLRLRV